MSQLDPQYNKKLAAFLSRTDANTREAVKEALALIRRDMEVRKTEIDDHYKRTQDAIYKLDRRMAEFESSVLKMMDVDPTTLSRAQLTRLARKLNL